MDTKDLMIGDLVIHGFGGIGKITEIDHKTVVIKDDGFDTGDGMNEVSFAINELTPIPLTPKILEENGFRKANYIEVVGGLDTYYLGEEIGSFRIHRLQKGYYQFGLAKIKYVHQLQHSLRLCGINKGITV